MSPRDTPLKAKIEGCELVIRIGIDVLAHTANNLYLTRGEEHRMMVINEYELAKDVISELLSEDEIGASMLTDTLDEAILAAFDNGSLAFEDGNF